MSLAAGRGAGSRRAGLRQILLARSSKAPSVLGALSGPAGQRRDSDSGSRCWEGAGRGAEAAFASEHMHCSRPSCSGDSDGELGSDMASSAVARVAAPPWHELVRRRIWAVPGWGELVPYDAPLAQWPQVIHTRQTTSVRRSGSIHSSQSIRVKPHMPPSTTSAPGGPPAQTARRTGVVRELPLDPMAALPLPPRAHAGRTARNGRHRRGPAAPGERARPTTRLPSVSAAPGSSSVRSPALHQALPSTRGPLGLLGRSPSGAGSGAESVRSGLTV